MSISVDEAIAAIFEQATSKSEAARAFDRVLALIAPHHSSLSWGDRLLTLDKSAAFRSDPAFASAFAAMGSSTGQTQYRDPDGIAWRLNTLIWAAREALKIPGDFVECGVFEGAMSRVVTQAVDLHAADRQFYLYDTFEGFSPKYSAASTDYPENPHLFESSDKIFRQPGLYEKVRDLFASSPEVRVIQGVVPDILHDVSPATIAYLHIDMNSPGPEIGALEILFDRVSPGGCIILDDYGWRNFEQQKIAADAFMGARGYGVLELPTGQGLVVKR